MAAQKEKAVLVIEKKIALDPELIHRFREDGFSIVNFDEPGEAKEIVRQTRPALIIARAACAANLLNNDILSERKGGVFLLDARLHLLGYFERTFLRKGLAPFLSDYLNALSQ